MLISKYHSPACLIVNVYLIFMINCLDHAYFLVQLTEKMMMWRFREFHIYDRFEVYYLSGEKCKNVKALSYLLSTI